MSPTRCRSFSVGRSLLTSTVPSKSSCSFCSTGVWLVGEKGGVETSGAKVEVETLGSPVGRNSERGGVGGRVSACCGAAGAADDSGAEAMVLLCDVSMVVASAV
jgi:hypothetical protein